MMMDNFDHSTPESWEIIPFSGVPDVHPEPSFCFIRWVCIDVSHFHFSFALFKNFSTSSSLVLLCFYVSGFLLSTKSRRLQFQVKRTSHLYRFLLLLVVC